LLNLLGSRVGLFSPAIEFKLLSCNKTPDRHFPICCLRPDISERKQKHFLERVPESKRETNDAHELSLESRC
jgi:hypothetical protein